MKVEFGLGLIGIGKPWGHVAREVPEETVVMDLLDGAFQLGLRFFDTAPSYGTSELRLGKFLSLLTSAERKQIRVASKLGEHWNSAEQMPFVDHSEEALKASLNRTLERLGSIDIIQLHKTTPQVLRSDTILKTWEYAKSLGIGIIGASVSDIASASIVVHETVYRLIQLPYNVESRQFEETIKQASSAGLTVVINRPFAMGKLLYGDGALRSDDAFAFILRQNFHGIVLSGTTNLEHLKQNYESFHRVCC